VDKAKHPQIEAAEQPIAQVLRDVVRALTGTSDLESDSLATAVEATATGFALLLLDGDFGEGAGAIEHAADQAVRAAKALINGRHLLSGES